MFGFKADKEIASKGRSDESHVKAKLDLKTGFLWLFVTFLLGTICILAYVLAVKDKELKLLRDENGQLRNGVERDFYLDDETNRQLDIYSRKKRNSNEGVCICTGDEILQFCGLVDATCEPGLISCDSGPCSSKPCENGARCTNLGSTYRCTCQSGWKGLNCETRESADMQWETYEATDCYGNDYDVNDGMSADQCERKCRMDVGCVAYNVLTSPRGRCWFKHTCDTNRFIQTPVVEYLFVKKE